MSLRHFKTACLSASALVTIATRSKHHYDIVAPDTEKRRQAKWAEHCRICSKYNIDPHSPNAAGFVKAVLTGVADYSAIEARLMSHYVGERGPLHG